MEDNYAFKALEVIGWGKFTSLTFVQCGTSWLLYELWYGCVAYIIQGVHQEWNVSDIQISILGSLPQIGIMIGSFLWGYISDTCGRKTAILSTAILGSISSILLTISLNYYMVTIFMTILGISMAGEYILAATMFCEFCPPSKRYYLVSLSVFSCIGAIMISLFAFFVAAVNTSSISNWRLILCFACFTQLVALVFRLPMKETPAFLVSKQRYYEANEILNAISMENRGSEFDFEKNSTENDCQYANLAGEQTEHSSKNHLVLQLFSKDLLKTTIILSLAYLSATFSFSGSNYFMPRFLSDFSTSEAYFIILMQQLATFPSVMFGSCLVETLMGRKYTTLIAYVISGISCLGYIFVNTQTNIIITTVVLNLSAFLGYGALHALASESFPTYVRNTGVGFASICSRIGGISSPAVTGIVLGHANGKHIMMSIYSAFYLIAGLSVILLKETKLKLEEKKV